MENEGPKENPTQQKPEKPMSTNYSAARPKQPRPQEYYEDIKQKFAEERDLRLKYRPQGTKQYFTDFDGTPFERYEIDPYAEAVKPREPITDTVEVLFIGGGFSALLTAARLRERGVESIRIVERGADVGGTWYWNRYPGAACDVRRIRLPAAAGRDGLRALAPLRQGAGDLRPLPGDRAQATIFYDLAVFRTTITSTTWDEEEKLWHLRDRSRRPDARAGS